MAMTAVWTVMVLAAVICGAFTGQTGEVASAAVEGARERGMRDARFFQDKAELTEELADLVRAGDLVWFKASRGMKLENILKALYGEETLQ